MKIPLGASLTYLFSLSDREYSDNIKEILVSISGGNIVGGFVDVKGDSNYEVLKKHTIVTLVGEKSYYHLEG